MRINHNEVMQFWCNLCLELFYVYYYKELFCINGDEQVYITIDDLEHVEGGCFHCNVRYDTLELKGSISFDGGDIFSDYTASITPYYEICTQFADDELDGGEQVEDITDTMFLFKSMIYNHPEIQLY